MKKVQKRTKLLQKLTVICLVFALAVGVATPVQAATTPEKSAAAVKKAVKSSNYPFGSSDKVTSKRKVFGVSVSKLDSYVAYQKTTGSGNKKAEYILFIGKATSKSNAKKAKTALKEYVSSEADSMNSYLSSDGKKSFKKAKVSNSGEWVWAIVLKSSGDNKKAEKAIKKKIK